MFGKSKKKSFWQDDDDPDQRTLCLSTPKHNGKSGTDSIVGVNCLKTLAVVWVLIVQDCATGNENEPNRKLYFMTCKLNLTSS